MCQANADMYPKALIIFERVILRNVDATMANLPGEETQPGLLVLIIISVFNLHSKTLKGTERKSCLDGAVS